tara:strand:+ start:130 stop:714 length:585 start_codon:yes stop_codon:yes gene_type:complete
MNEPDNKLIHNIQNHHDVKPSLEELVNRHSGIYFDIVSRYVPAGSTMCDRQELFEDKNFNIYNAALKYDPEKGAKFSTFLGNETKFVCLNAYNKAKKKPLITKAPEDLDFIEKEEETTIIDKVLLKEIYAMVKKNADPRVSKIFDLRYNEGSGNKVLPWNQIAPHVGLSIQGCINVHDMEIRNLKRKLKLDNKI